MAIKYLKDIYIEIFNYGFYNNPDESSKHQDKFIGRRKETDRLKMLLTRPESNSGTYLITGGKGMGKTTLVNHVINNVLPETNLLSLGRFLRLSIITLIFALFYEDTIYDKTINDVNGMHNLLSNIASWHNIWWFGLLIISLLISKNDSVSFASEYKPKCIRNLRDRLISLIFFNFIFNPKYRQDSNSRIVSQDVFIISLNVIFFKFIHLLLSTIQNNSSEYSSGEIFTVLLIQLIFLISIEKGTKHVKESLAAMKINNNTLHQWAYGIMVFTFVLVTYNNILYNSVYSYEADPLNGVYVDPLNGGKLTP